MGRMFQKVFPLLIVLLLVNCSNPPEQKESWFPLQEGKVWRYEVVQHLNSGKTERFVHEVENLPPKKIGERWLQVKRTSSGNRYYFQETADGIARIASQSIVETAPRPDVLNRFILRFPIDADTFWQYVSSPIIIKRSYPLGSIILTNRLQLRTLWVYVGMDETVQTPMQTFTHCLHVRGRANSMVPRDLGLTRSEGTFVTDEWYAKGVGLVKLVHTETVESEPRLGGKIVISLLGVES